MTPFTVAVSRNVHVFFHTLPAVRDGDVDGIHDARVAARRLRALLPVVLSGHHRAYADRCLSLLRQAGRLLGRARDLDIALDQLGRCESQLPSAGAVIADLRAALSSRHAKRRRRLVKGLDALPLAELKSLPRSAGSSERVAGHGVRDAANTAIAEQIQRVQSAVVNASGVYMSSRAHGLRIDTRMLRYLLEPLNSDRRISAAIKPLKRAQDVLGTLHDRQALIDLVDSATGSEHGRTAIRALAEQECRDLFRSYVEERGAVLQACDAAQEAIRPSKRGGRIAVAFTAMAIPSVFWFLHAERGLVPAVADAAVRTARRIRADERSDLGAERELALRK